MSISASVAAKLKQHLSLLYGDDCADIYARLEELIAGYQPALSKRPVPPTSKILSGMNRPWC